MTFNTKNWHLSLGQDSLTFAKQQGNQFEQIAIVMKLINFESVK